MEDKLAIQHQDWLPWKIHLKGTKLPLTDSEVCFSHTPHTLLQKPFKVHLERGRAAVELWRKKSCSETQQAEPDSSIQANSPINPVPWKPLTLQHIQSTGLERGIQHFSQLFWPLMRKAAVMKRSGTKKWYKGEWDGSANPRKQEDRRKKYWEDTAER